MTPSRAQKWLTLYREGWTARKVQSLGLISWVLDRGDERGVTITEAMRRAILDEQKKRIAEKVA